MKKATIFKQTIILEKQARVIDFLINNLGKKKIVAFAGGFHFLKNLLMKKEKNFYQKQVDYLISSDSFFNFSLGLKNKINPGTVLFDVVSHAMKNNLTTVIIGGKLKEEKKIKNDFNLFYGSAKSLFFFSEEQLYNSIEKIKKFFKKTNPQLVIFHKEKDNLKHIIIPELSRATVFLNLDIHEFYAYKKIKKSNIIKIIQYFAFFPLYFFYFFLLKLSYNNRNVG